MNDLEKKKELTREEIFDIVLGLDDNYQQPTVIFINFLKTNDLNIASIGSIKQYSTYLSLEHDGKRYSARYYNFLISVAKNRMRILFENTHSALSVLNRWKFEQELSKIKFKKYSKEIDDFISYDEYKQLLIGIEDDLLKLLIEFLYTQGCRISESLNILIKSDIQEGTDKKGNDCYKIKVFCKNRERILKVSVDLIDRINGYYNNPHRKYLFDSNKFGKRLNRNMITMQLEKYGKEILNKAHCGSHLFRHGFATQKIVVDKKNVKAVSKYLGHSTTAITMDMYCQSEMDMEDLELN